MSQLHSEIIDFLLESAKRLTKIAEILGTSSEDVRTNPPKDKKPKTEKANVEKPKEEPKVEKHAYTLEEVRKVLADKSRNGFTAQVKAIIEKYGATRLSEIDPTNYESVLKDAEEIGNA